MVILPRFFKLFSASVVLSFLRQTVDGIAYNETLVIKSPNEPHRRLNSNKKYNKAQVNIDIQEPKKKVAYVTDTDTVNPEYWKDNTCYKGMVRGGDGWCMKPLAIQQIFLYKENIPPSIDHIIFNQNCCKYLQDGIENVLNCAGLKDYESYRSLEDLKLKKYRTETDRSTRTMSCGIVPLKNGNLEDGRYVSYWTFEGDVLLGSSNGIVSNNPYVNIAELAPPPPGHRARHGRKHHLAIDAPILQGLIPINNPLIPPPGQPEGVGLRGRHRKIGEPHPDMDFFHIKKPEALLTTHVPKHHRKRSSGGIRTEVEINKNADDS